MIINMRMTTAMITILIMMGVAVITMMMTIAITIFRHDKITTTIIVMMIIMIVVIMNDTYRDVEPQQRSSKQQ